MSSYPFQDQVVTNEMKKLYCSTLRTLFDNVNYYVTKNNTYYKEILEKSKKYMDKIDKLSGDYPLDANDYFILMYKSLTVEKYKLGKNLLQNLKILIKNSFITGNSPLSEYNIDIPEVKENEELMNDGKIIDLMINCLTNIDTIFEDDDIWVLAIECLDEMVRNPNVICNIKGKSFSKIYMYYLKIFAKLENDKDVIKSIKEKILFMVDNTFEELNSYLDFSSSLLSNNNIKHNLMQIYNKLGTAECIENSKTNNYNPLDLYICREVKTLVDIICIRDARGELKNINDNNSNNNNIILPFIPKKDADFTMIKTKYLNQPEIKNEYVYPCGFFGWCDICRKQADYYSIDIRKPVCSIACRNILLKEEQQLQKIRSNLIKDCPEMFKYLCQILSNKSNTDMQKIFILEIISNILNNFGNKYNFISKKKKFHKNSKRNFSRRII